MKKKAARKRVPSPTGRPSAVRKEIKAFESGGGAGGGSRSSPYSKKKKTAAKKKTSGRKYGMDAPARRREKKAGL